MYVKFMYLDHLFVDPLDLFWKVLTALTNGMPKFQSLNKGHQRVPKKCVSRFDLQCQKTGIILNSCYIPPIFRTFQLPFYGGSHL